MNFSKLIHMLVMAVAVVQVAAHPDLSAEEMVEYKQHVARGAEALNQCLQSSEMQELNKRMVAERSETLQRLRKARDLNFRDTKPDEAALQKWNSFNHEQKGKSKDPQDLFGFKWNNDPNRKSLAGCVLTPEAIPGPYWHEGQLERQDIRAGQDGIYLRLAMQVVDVSTCHPVRGARVDVWQANALGEYSATNTSWLRGWQPSSPWGTVDFDTIFPGHYLGRATHIHVAVRPWEEKRVIHLGQVYFDEWPREKVERYVAYTGNRNPVTNNINDAFAPDSASDQYDPFTKWEWLGSKLTDGILAWITLGVNLTAQVDQPPNQKRSFLNDHLDH